MNTQKLSGAAGIFFAGLAAGVSVGSYVGHQIYHTKAQSPSSVHSAAPVAADEPAQLVLRGASLNPYVHPRPECQSLMDQLAELATHRVPSCPINRLIFEPLCTNEEMTRYSAESDNLSRLKNVVGVEETRLDCRSIPGYTAFRNHLDCLSVWSAPACVRIAPLPSNYM